MRDGCVLDGPWSCPHALNVAGRVLGWRRITRIGWAGRGRRSKSACKSLARSLRRNEFVRSPGGVVAFSRVERLSLSRRVVHTMSELTELTDEQWDALDQVAKNVPTRTDDRLRADWHRARCACRITFTIVCFTVLLVAVVLVCAMFSEDEPQARFTKIGCVLAVAVAVARIYLFCHRYRETCEGKRSARRASVASLQNKISLRNWPKVDEVLTSKDIVLVDLLERIVRVFADKPRRQTTETS